MSEMTQCNYCSMLSLRRRAEKDRQRVVVLPAKRGKYYMGGVDVFRFPKSIYTRAQFRKLTDAERERWWVCWFMELGDHCCC